MSSWWLKPLGNVWIIRIHGAFGEWPKLLRFSTHMLHVWIFVPTFTIDFSWNGRQIYIYMEHFGVWPNNKHPLRVNFRRYSGRSEKMHRFLAKESGFVKQWDIWKTWNTIVTTSYYKVIWNPDILLLMYSSSWDAYNLMIVRVAQIITFVLYWHMCFLIVIFVASSCKFRLSKWRSI